MLFACGIEVAASGFEVGGVAEGVLVDVDGVLAEGKIFEVELDGELAVLELAEGGGACVLAGAGFDGDDELVLRWLGEGWNGEEAEGEGDERVAHKSSLLKRLQGQG